MDRILFLTAAAAAVSCVAIDGGSVEASWVVRSADGQAITECGCADPTITGVRLTLVGASPEVLGSQPCAGRTACEFSCQRHTGASPFDIPAGSYLISLTPVDAAGQDLTVVDPARGPVMTPAPVLREVVYGQPTELDALAIVAACAPTCSSNKNRVCSSQ